MTDPAPRRIRRLSELPEEIAPPRDGWPALAAQLSGVRPARDRLRSRSVVAAAALLAALVFGMALDRWILRPAPAPRPVSAAPGVLTAALITDPRDLHEQAALTRALEARLKTLPAPTRRKVLESLATLQRSVRQIRRALGREPGNALLQTLLIETYQDQMQLLSSAPELGVAGTETQT